MDGKKPALRPTANTRVKASRGMPTASSSSAAMITRLLEARADPNIAPPTDGSPLMLVAQQGKERQQLQQKQDQEHQRLEKQKADAAKTQQLEQKHQQQTQQLQQRHTSQTQQMQQRQAPAARAPRGR